jgi:hypothetical protein
LKKEWLWSAKTSTSLAHWTVWWCIGQCLVLQAEPAVNWPLSGTDRATWLKITGLSGGAPDCPVSLQRPRPTVGYAISGQRVARTNDRLGTPDCYSSCLVVHRTTRQKASWSPTAPICLGAIKGTLKRMEQYTKHSLSILRHPDSASTHLIDCVSDLSSVWVVNSLCCVSSSSLGLCACVCCGLNLVCVAFPPLLLYYLWSKICKGEMLQLVKIPRKREKITKGKDCGIQVDHWITWKGLSAILVHWDATTWKWASVTWPNHGIKITCLLCCFSVIVLFARAHLITTWLNHTNTFIIKFVAF